MRAHLAICSHGYLGLITSDAPVATPYSGSYQDVAWTGIHMAEGREKKIGDRWQSKAPKILCPIADKHAHAIVERFNQDERWATFPGDHLMVNYTHTYPNGDIWCELENCDSYHHTENGWTQTAGTGAA